MNKLVALGVATAGAVLAFQFLPARTRHRFKVAMRRRMTRHMERMMANLPEGSPPKIVVSVLPRLQAQSDQIIAQLQELNALLREQRGGSGGEVEPARTGTRE